MTPARRKKEIVIAAVAAAIVLLIVFASPQLRLWRARQLAFRRISDIPPREKATLDCVLAAEVKAIGRSSTGGETVAHRAGGYELSLPAEEYRPLTDANNGFESDRLQVRLLSIAPRAPRLSPETGPTDDGVRAWLSETDPYDVVVEAFNATPAGIRTQTTRAGLQKHLYLLLLKSLYQPIGSEKLFLRFRTGERKGILAGDLTSDFIIVLVYLPETKEFAELLIAGKPGCEMDNVYRCLGQMEARRK
jgi:hypothetical protein